jgi:hypothetical protein
MDVTRLGTGGPLPGPGHEEEGLTVDAAIGEDDMASEFYLLKAAPDSG